MCFDSAVLLRWLKLVRDEGITLPAWLGLPGVANRMKLLQTSVRTGVGKSARFARKQSGLAGKLLHSTNYQPDELMFGLTA
tara:strand:- start:15016 stop:15258 length:243 start_codon:yes stop_codon:yes gene_type:complete